MIHREPSCVCLFALSLGSELSCNCAILSELIVEPVVHMHPEPVEDVDMVSEQMDDGRWGAVREQSAVKQGLACSCSSSEQRTWSVVSYTPCMEEI